MKFAIFGLNTSVDIRPLLAGAWVAELLAGAWVTNHKKIKFPMVNILANGT